ncbi:hypothetical protein MY8738_009958 [Beauveria namnaoensis]
MSGRITRSMQPTATPPLPGDDVAAGAPNTQPHADIPSSGTTAINAYEAHLPAGTTTTTSALSEPGETVATPYWETGELEADQVDRLRVLAKQSRARKRSRIIAQL